MCCEDWATNVRILHATRRCSAMPVLSHMHHLFNTEQCQTYIHTLRWQDRPLQCPRCQSHTIGRWAGINTASDANASGAIAASVPSTTLPIPCCTRASGRWRAGYLRPFCGASPARPGVLYGRRGAIAGRALAGAGGCAIQPCPMRCSARWRAWLKRVNSSTRLARRAKPSGVVKSPWGTAHLGAARSVSPVGGMTTKTGPPSSPGSVARERSSSRRPAIARSRRGQRRLTSRCTWAVGSTRTPLAAIEP